MQQKVPQQEQQWHLLEPTTTNHIPHLKPSPRATAHIRNTANPTRSRTKDIHNTLVKSTIRITSSILNIIKAILRISNGDPPPSHLQAAQIQARCPLRSAGRACFPMRCHLNLRHTRCSRHRLCVSRVRPGNLSAVGWVACNGILERSSA
jgi:hypothetical protein